MYWFLSSIVKTTNKYSCISNSVEGQIQCGKRAMLVLAYSGLFLQRYK